MRQMLPQTLAILGPEPLARISVHPLLDLVPVADSLVGGGDGWETSPRAQV